MFEINQSSDTTGLLFFLLLHNVIDYKTLNSLNKIATSHSGGLQLLECSVMEACVLENNTVTLTRLSLELL